MYILVVGFMLISATRYTEALIGYDCEGSTLNVTTLSLNDVKECEIPPREPEPTPTYIQLLQLSEFSETPVIQCKIEISRTINYCIMHSSNSFVHQNGYQEYLHEFDESSCRSLHETGTIRLGSTTEINGIRRNETTTRSVNLAGSTTTSGKCQGSRYSDPFGTWDNVVVHASLKITLLDYEAVVNLRPGKIDLRSGTQCHLADGHCVDVEGNSVFWTQAPLNSCNFNVYDVLYEGTASKFTHVKDEPNLPDVYTLTTDQTTFALAKRSEHLVCGYKLIRTEHPKLFVLETSKGKTFVTRKKISINNLDMFSYVNSKLIYVEKHVRKQMKNLYRDVITQRCNLERQILQGALTTASLLPERFARTVMKGPGYMAVIAGEVAHVIKCVPVDCKLRRTDQCFQELPVTYRNQSYFLSPTSRMLMKTATQINCDPVVPAQYQIDGTWYRFSPVPIEVLSPQLLEPLSVPTWKYESAGDIATSGIYTATDIAKLRERIMFPAEKPALLNNIARGAIGYRIEPGSVSIREFLDDETLQHIAENSATKFWTGFMKFGSASGGVVGVSLVLLIIKLTIDTIIRGYALHALYGWSLHLFGAFWESVAGLLFTLAHKNRMENNEDVESGQRADDMQHRRSSLRVRIEVPNVHWSDA